jgi:dUTP pyrophosphatase
MTNNLAIKMTILEHGKELSIPFYATEQSAGMDLQAANNETVILHPGDVILVPTGIAIALPEGFEAQIRPRSGLALKHRVTVLNAPGTIDADYRGEIKVMLINHGSEPFHIARGMRIAQMVIAQYIQAGIALVDSLDETERGTGGFGSTGQ